MSYPISNVNFRGSGVESCGTIGYRNYNPETAGSIGQNNREIDTLETENTSGKSKNMTSTDTVSFKAKDNSDKKFSTSKALFSIVGLTAATIIGLGYAHKSGSFNNIQKEWLKNTYGKLEPVAETCHNWCGAVKKTGTEWWNKLINLFKSKS